MNLNEFGSFVSDFLRPAADILLLSFLIYKTYQILVKTQAIQLIRGILILGGIYAISFFLRLSTLAWILGILAPGLVIALAIVFQPELRKIFMRLGQGPIFHSGGKGRNVEFEAVIAAAEMLSAKRRGALFVFVRGVGLKNIADAGTRLDSLVSTGLLVTIFEYDTPLHDGAVLIQNGRILSAGCFLPLSSQQDIRKSFGTRHRAALGVTEDTDAVVIVVSEETGAISLAFDGRLYYNLPVPLIRKRLAELLPSSGTNPGGDENHEEGTDGQNKL